MSRKGGLREFGFVNLGLCAIWVGTVSAGSAILLTYDSRPGEIPRQLVGWPSGSSLVRHAKLPTLVMFVHPHCPCTRASISELERLHSDCHGLAEFQVVAYQPASTGEDWRDSPIMRTLIRTDDVGVKWDRDGLETQRFGVATSGHVLLFDRFGRLQFTGGITNSRGHEGSNAGREFMTRFLRFGSREQSVQTSAFRTSVYGCQINRAGVAKQ